MVSQFHRTQGKNTPYRVPYKIVDGRADCTVFIESMSVHDMSTENRRTDIGQFLIGDRVCVDRRIDGRRNHLHGRIETISGDGRSVVVLWDNGLRSIGPMSSVRAERACSVEMHARGFISLEEAPRAR